MHITSPVRPASGCVFCFNVGTVQRGSSGGRIMWKGCVDFIVGPAGHCRKKQRNRERMSLSVYSLLCCLLRFFSLMKSDYTVDYDS